MPFQLLVASLALFICTAAQAKTIIVAADGSGDFKAVQDAVAAVPDNADERTIIHIRPGTYEGQIVVPKAKVKVTFEGDGVDKTFTTYHFNTNEPNPDGVSRSHKGTGVVVLGADFQAHNMTFKNESGDHGQALALRIDGDRAVVTDCHIVGWQDTLMVNTGRQYFSNDYIAGRVDFIYGSATAVFDHCEIHSRNGGFVTAASTPQDHPFGLVFMNCKLTGDATPWDPATTNPASTDKLRSTPIADLGRPWRPYASVTYINCEMGSHISPAGWNNWGKASNESTARYSEYHSTGPGGASDKRVPWSHQLSDEQAKAITVESVLGGNDHWDPLTIAKSLTSEQATTQPTGAAARE
jgi:pectinesterase